jgi:predicted lipoprotein with Yx(FWY)xxD motif
VISSSSNAMVCTKSTQLDGATQTVLATHAGKTLYAYKPDTSTSVVCTGGCALAWPPLTTTGEIASALNGLSGTIGTLAGGNGRQVVYNGHPLYTYTLDVGTGDARGQGAEGGNWSVVTPDEAPLGAPFAAPTPTDPPYNG